ncbi:phage tail protein [Hymenobacter metallicola]|uniref:Phage tail protein n=1 Tax=Hymenobacter metallicola TaxID=2563114 RepID=A0A4Z0QCZ7_9BACT|nr:tail fiber protein [Hymenobacter metallicola]TGE27356.1 phage tail protein [Hymenobacter metallicola]
MDEAYIGSLVLFAGNFAPRGWAFCDGSLLSIAQNSALFSILGTTYGGNGQTTFALPDLRGRTPVHANNGQAGPGVAAVQLGERAGTNSVTLNSQQLPAHTHGQQFMSGAATAAAPAAGLSLAQANGSVPSTGDTTATNIYGSSGTPVAGGQTSAAGNSQPVSVMQPYLGINYIICLQGLYPSRN